TSKPRRVLLAVDQPVGQVPELCGLHDSADPVGQPNHAARRPRRGGHPLLDVTVISFQGLAHRRTDSEFELHPLFPVFRVLPQRHADLVRARKTLPGQGDSGFEVSRQLVLPTKPGHVVGSVRVPADAGHSESVGSRRLGGVHQCVPPSRTPKAAHFSYWARARAMRQPCMNSGMSTYSSVVWMLCCPAPKVTVGTPCRTSQLASRPPLPIR